MASTPRPFSHSHHPPNLPSLVLPNDLALLNSGSSSSRLSPSPSCPSSFRSQRSDSGCSSESRWHKSGGKDHKAHVNIYTSCGRHSNEWLFGGLSWSDIWWWILGWTPFSGMNGSRNRNGGGEEGPDYLVREEGAQRG